MSEFYHSKRNKKSFIGRFFEFILIFAFSYFVILPCLIHFSGFDNYLLYKPVKEYNQILDNLKGKYKEVKIKTKDKQTLYGWYIAPKKDKPVVLYFYGNKGNISEYQSLISYFQSKGFGIFTVDYRGYGNSSGKPDQKKLYDDGLLVYDYLLKNIKAKKIVLYGENFGAYLALNLAKEKGIKNLIIHDAFPSIRGLAKEMAKLAKLSKYPQIMELNIKFFEYLPIFQNYDSIKIINEIKLNKALILHSSENREIPVSMGKDLSKLIKNSEFYEYTPENADDINDFKDKLDKFMLGI